ncbi:MAG: flippase-like domain-containing protein [Synergistaceae bacterium]|nr:flippase-like domain-containing protein [Synergistaceae bacterium]
MAEAAHKRILGILLKYGVSIFCLFYVFRDVPFADLTAALGRYPVLPMLGVVGVSFTAYAIMGLRLSFMAKPPLSFRSTFCATLVGLAINNVLPAKAGEVAKAVWIGRDNGVSFQKTLGIVFMERFFDVNVLALLSLWVLWAMGQRGAAAVFVACLAAGWCILILFRSYPRLAKGFTSLFGRGRLHRFVSQALSGVLENMSPRRLVWLLATSLTIWCFYSLQMILSVNAVAKLGLDWSTTLSVFAVSGLGMLLPSSPGAIGVYEAVIMTALKHYGVGPDEALALALFSHMAQFIPVTLVGGIVFAAFPAKRGRIDVPTEL